MASMFDTNGRPSRQDALDYHSSGRKGKIEDVPTKPVATARDLCLAYSPGVAEPCLEIAQDPDLSYKYTARGNLVAVISNGTARSEEHTLNSSHSQISYAVFCLKKKK